MELLKISSLLLLGFCTLSNAAAPTKPPDQILVDNHNTERASVGASNMLAMAWNSTMVAAASSVLSTLASTGCILNGAPSDPAIGVNYYATSDYNAAWQKWLQAEAKYDSNTLTCNDSVDPLSCDPYLQIVYSEASQIGCAVGTCGGSPMLVCAYNAPYRSPSGDAAISPYLIGKACTKCSTGQFYCTKSPTAGLCNQTCTTCDCKADCKNCGKLSSKDCRCQCPIGRTGVDCTGPCNNTLDVCETAPFWGPDGCDGSHPWVPYYCPAVCTMQTCAPSKCPAGFTFIDGLNIANDSLTGTCIAAFFEPLTQTQAAKNCSAKGNGRLVYIETMYELSAIMEYWTRQFPDQVDPGVAPSTVPGSPVGFGSAWIGGCRKSFTSNDPLNSFVWTATCTSGTEPKTGIKPFSFTNWNDMEPNNKNADPTGKIKTTGEWCVEMFVNPNIVDRLQAVWNDVDCSAVRGFYICEADPLC